MNASQPPSLAEELAAVHAWWRQAGVDHAYSDEPQNWIAAEPEKPAKPELPDGTKASLDEPRHKATPAIDRSAWPQNLEAFVPWWLSDPALDDGSAAARIAPRGATACDTMIIVPQPEQEDRDSLLTGPQGRLLKGLLRAMAIAEESAYLASAMPGYTALPDWERVAAMGLGDVLRHHVQLVRPRRVLIFGRAILPLLGHDPAQSPASFREIALEGSTVPAMATWDLARLLENPRWRADFWSRWLAWTANDDHGSGT